ncbi:MAG: hypothetical protein ACYC4U_14025 [Pirellulaceae bacterium]
MKDRIQILGVLRQRKYSLVDGWLETSGIGSERRFDPFSEETGLFVEFARLVSTREAVIEFVSKYGSPTGDWKELHQRIRDMRMAVEAWQSGEKVFPLTPHDPELEASWSIIKGSVVAIPDTSNGKLMLVFHSILDIMWLQLYFAVTDGADLRNCKQCGKPIVLFPPATRSTREYCSHACNTAAYRSRQTAAKTTKGTKRATKKKGSR